MPAAQAYLQRARELTTRHDALLIFDEVQTGNGRTGHLYAYQHFGVVPDVLSTAKGLGGGFPIGAMLTTDALAQTLQPGTHGSTYGGNPLGCAVAGAVLDEVLKPALQANVQARHRQLVAGLASLQHDFGLWTSVRGLGLLIGAVLAPGRTAASLVAAGLEAGVWMLQAGPEVLRFAPPLNITEAEMAEGLARLRVACKVVQG